MGFDFSSEQRRELGYKLIDRIDRYFSSLPDRPVQQPLEQRRITELCDAMPEVPQNAAEMLDALCTEMEEKGFHVPSANYFGLMNPTPAYMAVLAEALVSAMNPQLASLARSQFASSIEAETVRWIASRIGWAKHPAPADEAHPTCDGTFTSGGNEANFTALALALSARYPDVVEDGIASIGARPVLYASAESHHSLDKSVGLLGLGRKALHRVALNDRLQMNSTRLIQRIEEDLAAGFQPLCIVATAGTTNSGAIDDLRELSAIAKRYGLWLHVDGAYGAAAVFSDKHRHLVDGIELADSITIDPHKWLAMPFAAGVVLTRHVDLLQHVFGVTTPYMPRVKNTAIIDNFKIGAQWSRRMNSLKLWLTLRVHGRLAYEQMIDRQLTLAASIARWINASADFEMAAPHRLPILNFRVKGGMSEREREAAHLAILEAATRSGNVWFSHTHVRGESVLRLMVISYLSGEENVAQLVSALEMAAHEVLHASATR